MATRIVVCSDESQGSIEGTDWLAESSIVSDSHVLVLNVLEHKVKHEDKTKQADIATSPSNASAELLKSVCPAATINATAESGPVGKRLLECSFDWQSDLIVLGTHNRWQLEKMLLGSVSQYVIERAHCPVMIARRSDSAAKDNVLVAVDNSECSASALEWLSSEPWARDKNIVILSVLHKLPSYFDSFATTAEAAEMLLDQQFEQSLFSQLVERWSDELAECLGKELVHFAIAEGDPVELILRAAHHWPCDMIVLGSHGRSGISKLLLGSVSQSVAVKAPCSVVIVRGRTADRFNAVRTNLIDSNDLAATVSEKPHPARIHSVTSGSGINGFMTF